MVKLLFLLESTLKRLSGRVSGLSDTGHHVSAALVDLVIVHTFEVEQSVKAVGVLVQARTASTILIVILGRAGLEQTHSGLSRTHLGHKLEYHEYGGFCMKSTRERGYSGQQGTENDERGREERQKRQGDTCPFRHFELRVVVICV